MSHQDVTLQRRLVAGLVAYVAMLQHGSVRVKLQDGKGMVAFLDKPDGAVVELDAPKLPKKIDGGSSILNVLRIWCGLRSNRPSRKAVSGCWQI